MTTINDSPDEAVTERQPLATTCPEDARFLAALYPTRKERALSWLVGRCYDRNDESGPWNWLGDRADDLRIRLQNRRADKGVGWSRPATVGRKVNSADRTSTPPHHLPPLPDECYPPGAQPIPFDPDDGTAFGRGSDDA